MVRALAGGLGTSSPISPRLAFSKSSPNRAKKTRGPAAPQPARKPDAAALENPSFPAPLAGSFDRQANKSLTAAARACCCVSRLAPLAPRSVLTTLCLGRMSAVDTSCPLRIVERRYPQHWPETRSIDRQLTYSSGQSDGFARPRRCSRPGCPRRIPQSTSIADHVRDREAGYYFARHMRCTSTQTPTSVSKLHVLPVGSARTREPRQCDRPLQFQG